MTVEEDILAFLGIRRSLYHFYFCDIRSYLFHTMSSRLGYDNERHNLHPFCPPRKCESSQHLTGKFVLLGRRYANHSIRNENPPPNRNHSSVSSLAAVLEKIHVLRQRSRVFFFRKFVTSEESFVILPPTVTPVPNSNSIVQFCQTIRFQNNFM